MSKTLALLSGKGGSGKTTLALSISSVLSMCDIKVLLIDCDLCTNGATYFYEGKLNEIFADKDCNKSFSEVINNSYNRVNYIHINDNFDFLPSISQIKEESDYTPLYTNFTIEDFLYDIKNKYDIILFDCQAGYTELLKSILPHVDINLFVMEADAISSSSIRSLFLKIGGLINKKKTYQIFNKVSQEEYETYSKLSGGTVFTNIETVRFDWKIRKAFSVAQIPDMENTSSNYGEQIYNICNILFNEENLQAKLKQFEIVMKLNKETEAECILQKKIENIQKDNRVNRRRNRKNLIPLLATFFSIMVATAFTFFLFENRDISFYLSLIFFLLMIIICCALIVLVFIGNSNDEKNNRKELIMHMTDLHNVQDHKKLLQRQLSEMQKK